MHVISEAVERIDFSLKNFMYAQLHKRLSISELLNNSISDYATSNQQTIPTVGKYL